MGSLALLLYSVLAVLLAVSAQFDNSVFVSPLPGPASSIQMGKECEAAFHCWRTEAVDQFGQPLSLAGEPL